MRKTLGCKQVIERGFSILELVVVISVGIILTGMAIPKINSLLHAYRSVGDARSLNEEVSLAKMRAAANFTQARVFADLSKNQYRVESWVLPTGGTSKCWVTESDTHCSSSYSSPSTPPSTLLLTTVIFGSGSISSPPGGTQSTLAQAPLCLQDDLISTYSNSACITFNSRGVPVDSTGTATSNDALYVTDGNSVYGVTVLATGLIQTWRTDLNSANWINR